MILEIFTPEKKVLEETVDFVVVPAREGELGILPKHAPLIAQLSPGELRFHKGGEIKYFVVAGGFVEVHPIPTRVSVFAEAAELAEEIDLERARQAAARSKAILFKKQVAETDLAQAQAALRRALVRLKIAEIRRFKHTQIPPTIH